MSAVGGLSGPQWTVSSSLVALMPSEWGILVHKLYKSNVQSTVSEGKFLMSFRMLII